jgi:glutamyl-tRNA synthetase
MHIGNLRTALFAYLLTRNQGGKFILRIEDTDQERFVEGAIDVIYNTLRDAGMHWDEGPDIGGDYGPYIQSERRGIYKKYAQELVENGGAYLCFCDKERLDNVRAICEASKKPPMYDGLCRGLSESEIKEKIDKGIPYVIRQKMPRTGTTSFDDAVFGRITVENAALDDQILLKSDGLPTYNFANVVDDHLMGITHIIRGNEYLSSAPKYNLLYTAFGWEIPEYIHVSPVMRNSHKKLSKRDGDASYQDFIKKGYLKEAIINYIALLGWSPAEEREKFTLDELIQRFNVENISKSPAIFDENKLAWLNGEYIRAMSLDEFYGHAAVWISQAVKNTDYNPRLIASVLQPRCERLSDIPAQIDFFDTLPDYPIELFSHKKMKTTPQTSKPILEKILNILETISDFNQTSLHDSLLSLVSELELKNGQVLFPLRVALSGKEFTPGGGVELAAILGKDESINRIKIAINKLCNGI